MYGGVEVYDQPVYCFYEENLIFQVSSKTGFVHKRNAQATALATVYIQLS
jgi:hypothetical protein